MLLDDGVHDRQAQAGSLGLRREERLEDVRLRLGADARASVLDDDDRLLGSRRGARHQPAARGHRLDPVKAKVHEDLLQAVGIARSRGRRQLPFHDHAAPVGLFRKQVEHAAEELHQVDGLRPQLAGAREL